MENLKKDFIEGFLIGSTADASVYQRKKSEYIVEWEQKNRKWLETIKELAGKGRIRKVKTGYWRLVIYSKKLYTRHYSIFLCDKKFLEIISQILRNEFGIKSTVTKATKNEYSEIYALCIYSKNEILKFLRKIGTFHPGKIRKFKRLLQNP